MTPDDAGYPIQQPHAVRARARQNVILELGYFIGKLTRKRVCALCKGDVEIPSDYHGVLYIPMDALGGWRLRLADEMRTAGIPIDLNLALARGGAFAGGDLFDLAVDGTVAEKKPIPRR